MAGCCQIPVTRGVTGLGVWTAQTGAIELRAAGIGHRGPEPLNVDVSPGQNLACLPEAF